MQDAQRGRGYTTKKGEERGARLELGLDALADLGGASARRDLAEGEGEAVGDAGGLEALGRDALGREACAPHKKRAGERMSKRRACMPAGSRGMRLRARQVTEVDEVLRDGVVVLRVDVRDELEQRVLQVRRNLQYRGTKEGGWEGVHHRAEAGAILEEGVRILQRSLRRRTCSVMPQSRMHSRPSVVRRRLPGCGSQCSVPVSRSIVRYALIATPHSRGTSGLASLCRGRERKGWEG